MSLHFKPFSDFVVVVGMKASGKTTLTKFYCKQLRTILIIDPTWQINDIGFIVYFPERIRAAFNKFQRVTYHPKNMTTEAYTQTFQSCLDLTNYTLIIDEIDKFARPRWYLCNQVMEIINRGRAQGIGLICNTRRPHMIHNDIRSNADHVICFQLHEERDRKYMSEWLGVDAEKIRTLPPYHSFYYNVHENKVSLQTPLF